MSTHREAGREPGGNRNPGASARNPDSTNRGACGLPGRCEAEGRGRGRAVHSLPAKQAGTEPSFIGCGRQVHPQPISGAGGGAFEAHLAAEALPPSLASRAAEHLCVRGTSARPARPSSAGPDPTRARPAMGPPCRSLSALLLLLLLQVRRVPLALRGTPSGPTIRDPAPKFLPLLSLPLS